MTAQWPIVEAALGLAGWTVVRATLLLAGAALLSLALRRGSAEARHALWTVTLGGLLALPVLSVVVPPVPVNLPGAKAVAKILGGSGPGLERPGQIASDGEGEARGTSVATARGIVESWTVLAPGTLAPRESEANFPTAPHADPSHGIPPRSEAIPGGGISGGGIPGGGIPGDGMQLSLLLLWMGGVLALSLPLALGMARARRMCRRALTLRDAGWPAGPWMAALARTARKVGLRRRVSLRVSPRARTAMAGGVRHPVVLLPDDAVNWSDERRDLVLTHELVHLRRFDPVRQLCGRLVLAIYWFHPLAWWAVRAAAIAREEACDEAVLRLGHRPSTYARHLVELAAAPRRPLPSLSAMDSPRLEKRIMTILHAPHPGNQSPRRRWAIDGSTLCAAAWAVAAALVVPVDRAVAAAPADVAVAETVVEAAGQAVPERARQAVPVRPPPPEAPSPPPVSVPFPDPPPPLSAPFPNPPPPLSAPFPDPPPPLSAPLPKPPPPGAARSVPLPERPPQAVAPPDPRCSPLRVGPGRGVDREPRAAEAEPVLSAVLEQPDGTWLCMQRRGAAQFAPDGRLFSALPEGDWLVVSGADGDGLRRVEMESRAGGVASYWLVDGEERPFGAEARSWLGEAMQRLGQAGAVLPAGRLQQMEPLLDTLQLNRLIQQVRMVDAEALREKVRDSSLSAEQLEATLETVQEAVRQARDAHVETRGRLEEVLQGRWDGAGFGSPLIVIDGVILSRGAGLPVDPDRIESIDVISGMEATGLYGSRARNGVVIITTRRR